MTEPVFSNCFAVIIIVDQLGAVLHTNLVLRAVWTSVGLPKDMVIRL